MSKITNDGLTRSGTGCCIAELVWQQLALEGQSKTKPRILVLIKRERIDALKQIAVDAALILLQ